MYVSDKRKEGGREKGRKKGKTRKKEKRKTRRQVNDDIFPQKRHIGNDIVHIIWSEHKRDYNPATITSQFNDAHVIIYPLPSGLFRIQIAKKEKVCKRKKNIHSSYSLVTCHHMCQCVTCHHVVSCYRVSTTRPSFVFTKHFFLLFLFMCTFR